jgi:four helix bundle protein
MGVRNGTRGQKGGVSDGTVAAAGAIGVIVPAMKITRIPQRRVGMAAARRIDAWHLGLELVVQVYRLTRSFPREELFGLTSQMRRCALSAPSNVAEGVERDTAADRRRFLTDARSSLSELETQLEASRLLEYITEEQLLETLELTDHLSRMLTNMKRNIKDRPPEPER